MGRRRLLIVRGQARLRWLGISQWERLEVHQLRQVVIPPGLWVDRLAQEVIAPVEGIRFGRYRLERNHPAEADSSGGQTLRDRVLNQQALGGLGVGLVPPLQAINPRAMSRVS